MSDLSKLGIIAGGGGAPQNLIQACQDLGRPFFVVCLEGQAEMEIGGDIPHAWLPLGAGTKLKKLFEEQNIAEIVMIGRVRRPSLTEIKPDWLALKVLTKIGMNKLGDDGLLRAIGKALEDELNVRVVGVQDVLADLLTPEGLLTKTQPDETAQADIQRGIEVAQALGKLDVGQAVVVQQGIVLGVEAAEGTDALIDRASGLRREGLGGILVKLAKPQQDNRFDLPTIGVQTVESVAQAGLRGIVVHAGRSLIVNREATLAAAEAANIFVIGKKID